MESYIAGGVESILLDELSFTPSPGASYILNKSQVRFYPSGSSIYSPTSGQRVCKINLTGPSNMWLNPQSIRMVFDLKNTVTGDGTDNHELRMLTGGWGFWRRLDVRMGGVQVESISNMNRVQELFMQLSSATTQERELIMSGGRYLENVNASPTIVDMGTIPKGDTRNVSIPIISGLLSQNKFLWPNAAPIEFSWELDDDIANVYGGAAHSTSWQIQNVYLIADAVEMDSALLNRYVEHLAQGKSLSWEIKTLNSVLHSVGSSHANFSCNQSRAYTKLDTLFATFIRTQAEGATFNACRKPVSWFQGLKPTPGTNIALSGAEDNLEAYLTIGSKRIPLFPEQKVNMHYYRLLQACGKNASDVHSLSINRDDYITRSFALGFDLEKLPPGTLASFSGENTRSGDLLSLYVKNLFKASDADKVETVHIICQFVSILRLSASGVDLLD